MPPQINFNELYSMQKRKLVNRRKCFDHIIELCHRRIRTVSSYCGQNTFYEIPGFIVGFPLYNINECIEYIVEALRKNGFLIQMVPTNIGVIYISWDPRELRPQKALPPPPPVSINQPKQQTLFNNPHIAKVNNPIGYREQMRLF